MHDTYRELKCPTDDTQAEWNFTVGCVIIILITGLTILTIKYLMLLCHKIFEA